MGAPEPTYLECWALPRQTIDDLIDEACAGFAARFGTRPAQILISPAGLPEGLDRYTYCGISVCGAARLRCRDRRWRVAVGPVPTPAPVYQQQEIKL